MRSGQRPSDLLMAPPMDKVSIIAIITIIAIIAIIAIVAVVTNCPNMSSPIHGAIKRCPPSVRK